MLNSFTRSQQIVIPPAGINSLQSVRAAKRVRVERWRRLPVFEDTVRRKRLHTRFNLPQRPCRCADVSVCTAEAMRLLRPYVHGPRAFLLEGKTNTDMTECRPVSLYLPRYNV